MLQARHREVKIRGGRSVWPGPPPTAVYCFVNVETLPGGETDIRISCVAVAV